MEEAGLTPIEILRSGTSAIGAYYDDVDQFGSVAPNMRADLVLLDENPLENMDNLKNPAGVMVRGKWLSREMIDKALSAIEARARP